MQLNTRIPSIYTHEGVKAKRVNPELQLRRSVMACMLWESEFYESGEDIAKRIASLVGEVKPEIAAQIAIEARTKAKLRHVPLWIVRAMAKLSEHKKYVAATLAEVIQRPDELTEFLAMYWKDGKTPLSAQVKKGLAKAFTKFNAYQLGKYNRDNAIKLRDVLFLCHAKPKDEAQGEVWKKLVSNTLEIPDTWEVELSAGKGEGKKESWERLLKEKKLGALALLRNLRNMQQAGVEERLISDALKDIKTERVLPYRFIAAANHAPRLEAELEEGMFKCLAEVEKLQGKTILLIDVSGSMDGAISSKSDLTRLDAACGLAMLTREILDCHIFTFSNNLVEIPPRRGFALKDAIHRSQPHGGTELGGAINMLNKHTTYERLIVITDEQSHDRVPDPKAKRAYMINVASNKNGVGYGTWTHIDGWSESVIDYIRTFESES